MTHRMPGILVAVLLSMTGVAQAADEKFEHANIRLEQNATDNDAEIVFEAVGGDAGMAELKVTAPGGRVVLDFKAPDSKLGIRHVNLESPEPKNDGRVQADFPAGEYVFTATTVDGVKLHSKVALSHKLPETTVFIHPRPEATGLPVKGLQIKWSPVKNLAACVITIEQKKTDVELKAKLSGTTTSFVVPDGFLAPNAEYVVVISSVSHEGNMSSVETSFATGPKK